MPDVTCIDKVASNRDIFPERNSKSRYQLSHDTRSCSPSQGAVDNDAFQKVALLNFSPDSLKILLYDLVASHVVTSETIVRGAFRSRYHVFRIHSIVKSWVPHFEVSSKIWIRIYEHCSWLLQDILTRAELIQLTEQRGAEIDSCLAYSYLYDFTHLSSL